MMHLISDLDKVCVAKAREAGQGHVFDSWEDLAPEDQQGLLSQVEAIDFQFLHRLVQQHVHTVTGPPERRALRPAPVTPLPDPQRNREEFQFCRNLAEYALVHGEVLVVTAAGSGLGPACQPVGLLPIGPITGKTVFQLFAEKIQAVRRRNRISLPWNIFCHPDHLESLRDFFKARQFFGLKASTVRFTPQELLPVVDKRGKIVLSSPARLAVSPSGHGSILLHFLKDRRIEDLEASGVRHILYHQVDNPLVRIGDPAFLGLHIQTGSEISSKAVRKSRPDESVGVFCQYNESIGVVEYMELPPEERDARRADGGLAFSAANIGVHLVSLQFLKRMRDEGLQLPFHAIERTTPCIKTSPRRALPGKKDSGVMTLEGVGRKSVRMLQPTEPNSIAFRSFVFDAIPFARRAVVTEVSREEEFSPIKNLSGDNSPQTAQRDLSRMYGRWLRAASYPLPDDPAPDSPLPVEISPLAALDADDLTGKELLPSALPPGILIGGTT